MSEFYDNEPATQKAALFYSCVAAERGHVNLFLPEAAAAADGAAVEPEKTKNKQTAHQPTKF